MVSGTAWGAAAGMALDRALGEPPARWHPVAAFGTVMRVVEARVYRDDRAAGVAHAVTGAAVGAGAGAALGRAVGAPAAAAAATYVAVAQRELARQAQAVGVALEAGDLDTARRRLPALVGRDPSTLDEKEIARAVVESLAENTVDAVVAPAVWSAVAGAPAVLAYRAVNTMDAMVGHRDARYLRYGWAAARADDAANYLPARLTALLVAAVRPRKAAEVWRTVRRDAPGHPSPNAGVAEAAFAAALGVRLGGANRYGDRVELRPCLGDGRPAEPGDVEPAVRLAGDVAAALAVALAGAGAVGRVRGRAARRREARGWPARGRAPLR